MKETRTFNTTYTRDGESRTITGLAAIYNSRANLGWFEEEIAPGAFDDAVDVSDVRALFNHDPNLLLARQGSGTLQLNLTERGLEYQFEAPNTTVGNDLMVLMDRGDVNQSSFAFTIADGGQEWRKEKRGNETIDVRRITKIDRLYDVSPVTYPAYEDTTAAKRSYEAAYEAEKEETNHKADEAAKRSARLREIQLTNLKFEL
jgi:HK97 family phage prohead protease